MPTGIYIRTELNKQHLRDAHKGMSRLNHSDETKLILSNQKLGAKNHRFGKKASKETLEKKSIALKGRFTKEDHCNWKGGQKASEARHYANKKQFGFIQLNEPFFGSEGHHIDKMHVLNIPKELHESMYHSLTKNINIDKLNQLAWNWYEGE